MLWSDLRAYLSTLEEAGDLRKVAGADWNLEIGAITEQMVERGGPALLFDEIPGYPKGFRIACNLTQKPQHVARIFGLDHHGTAQQIAAEWDRVRSEMEPVPPVEVETGPVMQNVITGKDIDLLKFPAPKWHEADGNRYLGTGVCVIQRDPEIDFVNVGCYRVAVHDKATCGIFQSANNHGDRIRRKYWARGEKAPVVIVVGEDPILTVLAGGAFYRAPYGTSEYGIAGYLQGDPYPVVTGRVTGLPIPASAEIVMEGFIVRPEDRLLDEGPFGEWTGYYGHGRRPETVIEVAAVYHRDDPIIFGDPPIRPLRAYHEVRFYNFGSEVKEKLEQQGIKGIKSVFQIARPNFSVLAMEQMYEGHVEEVIRALVPGGDRKGNHQIWVIVDDDIDPTNTKEVLWAIASRLYPDRGITIVPGTSTDQLNPRVPPGQRSDPSQQGRVEYDAPNLVINACRPWGWKDEFPAVNKNSPELTASIREKWQSLFRGLPEL